MRFYLIVFFFISNASASIDYNITSLLRSFPIGGFSQLTIGKSIKTWEQNKKVMYGFMRPSLSYKTSVLLNAISPQIDIYPISFIGLYTGKTFAKRRPTKLDTFNCEIIECQGDLQKSFFGIKMALAWKSYFLLYTYKQTDISILGSKFDYFVEETSSLQATSDNDLLKNHTLIIGKKLQNNYQAGLLFVHNKITNYPNNSYMLMAMAGLERNKFSYIFSSGIFKTRNNQQVWTTLFMIKWTGSKGILIF